MRRANEKEHERLIAKAAQEAARRGHTFVKSDLPGGVRPQPVGGEVPDVAAAGLLVECETTDSLEHPHVRTQWPTFAAAPATKFVVCVPKGLGWKVEATANKLGVRVDEIWEL
ncbi:MAG: hypothetical protein ACT4PT_10165 [Methanobacteriota archaeon]